ncbi:GNAT family N-acetyltransferase [Catellatospora citrea]|uniref:GNAT family N-acetyltransferase n=1 Tax=Catellatospora citrea TaxID=53366 RepID=UPI0033F6EE76
MIIEVDTAVADESLLRRMYEIRRACQLAANPDEPIEDAATGVSLLRRPRMGGGHRYLVAGDPAVGFASVDLPPDVTTAFVRVYVEPGRRRQGTGGALFDAAVAHARSAGRTVLTGMYGDDDGAAFAAARGARVGQTVVRSLLRLPASGEPVPVPGHRAVTWLGPVSDELLESYTAARNAIHDAPTDAGVQWPHVTAQAVREQEETVARRGVELRVTAILDAAGAVVAFTQVLVPATGDVAFTEETAVVPASRRRGLARWVKAESLRLLAADRPEMASVGTTNAAVNTGMLAVNRALGFRPVGTWTTVVYDVA